jgi:hydrogenase maturation protease
MDTETLVIGIGNPLQGDDGLGACAVQMLANEVLPAGVQIEELGTPGWGLVNFLQGWQRVILIDAVCMGEEPGTWRRLEKDDIQLVASDQVRSLHEPGLAESLSLAQTLGLLPDEIVLYGVEPACIQPGGELSPAVRQVVTPLVKQILGELWKKTQTPNESC